MAGRMQPQRMVNVCICCERGAGGRETRARRTLHYEKTQTHCACGSYTAASHWGRAACPNSNRQLWERNKAEKKTGCKGINLVRSHLRKVKNNTLFICRHGLILAIYLYTLVIYMYTYMYVTSVRLCLHIIYI